MLSVLLLNLLCAFAAAETSSSELNVSSPSDAQFFSPRELSAACTESAPTTYPLVLSAGSDIYLSCSASSLRYASYSLWSSPGDLMKIIMTTDCAGYNADTASYVSIYVLGGFSSEHVSPPQPPPTSHAVHRQRVYGLRSAKRPQCQRL